MQDGYAVNACYSRHCYAVTDVYQTGGAWYVRLYNPWGADRVHDTNIQPRPDAVNDGYMAVTWANFIATFYQYSYA